MSTNIDNDEEALDVRGVIGRLVELETERDDCGPEDWARENPDEHAELTFIEPLLNDLSRNLQ